MSSLLDAGVAASAGGEALNPARSVHEAAQVWAVRSKVVTKISLVAPLTAT